jgi:hypothetical protein
MTGPRDTRVRVSADSATVVRWSPELGVRRRVDSTVPGRHRSTGWPPTGDCPAGQGHRDEQMRASFAQVAVALPVDDDLLPAGDGVVVEHFADHVRADTGLADEAFQEVARDPPVDARRAPAGQERTIASRRGGRGPAPA